MATKHCQNWSFHRPSHLPRRAVTLCCFLISFILMGCNSTVFLILCLFFYLCLHKCKQFIWYFSSWSVVSAQMPVLSWLWLSEGVLNHFCSGQHKLESKWVASANLFTIRVSWKRRTAVTSYSISSNFLILVNIIAAIIFTFIIVPGRGWMKPRYSCIKYSSEHNDLV